MSCIGDANNSASIFEFLPGTITTENELTHQGYLCSGLMEGGQRTLMVHLPIYDSISSRVNSRQANAPGMFRRPPWW